jgi:predicted transcriptional regulator
VIDNHKLHAWHIVPEPQGEPEKPDPAIRRHPLATAHGVSPHKSLLDCHTCDVRQQCAKNNRAGLPFALPECEAALDARNHVTSMKQRIITALGEHGPQTMVDLCAAAGLSHSTVKEYMTQLCRAGIVARKQTTAHTYIYTLAERTQND